MAAMARSALTRPWVVLTGAVVAGLLLTAGVLMFEPRPHGVLAPFYEPVTDTKLALYADADPCDVVTVSMQERADRVVVSLRGRGVLKGACERILVGVHKRVDVTLHAPLGKREVVNEFGRVMHVGRPPGDIYPNG